MRHIGCDDGRGEKFAAYVMVGDKPKKISKGSLREVIMACQPGDQVTTETSFENFNVTERNSLVELAASRGVSFKVLSSRAVNNWRLDNSLPKKTDNFDSKTILRLSVSRPEMLMDARTVSSEKHRLVNDIRAEAGRTAIYLRTLGYKNLKTRPDLQKYLASLPPVAELAPETRQAIVDGKSYRLNFVVPVVVAALTTVKAGGTRAEFDSVMGMSASGYPSLFRSNIFKHRIPAMTNQLLKEAGIRKKKGMNTLEFRKRAEKNLRRSIRMIFSKVKNSGTFDSLADTDNPTS